MPPKQKAAERQAQKEAEAAARAAQEAERVESAKWAVGAKDNRKQLADEEKEAEKRRKAAEKAALEAAEDAEMSGITKKKAPKKKGKDDFDLLNAALKSQPKTKAQKEAEAKKKAAEERKKKEAEDQKRKEEQRKKEEEERRKQAAKGIVMNHTDELMVPINNRPPDEDDAGAFEDVSGLNAAIDVMQETVFNVTQKEDRNPEKRRKALFNAYREAQLPIVKESHPGLRLSQYNDMIFNNWKRAPENPDNQNRKEPS